MACVLRELNKKYSEVKALENMKFTKALEIYVTVLKYQYLRQRMLLVGVDLFIFVRKILPMIID